eukprot:TRINITY_DN240_c0_g1_i3.p2 TRINITY_DN240_c0_g1~~TRINITY_DN240_c0_g1_i3.p2  ORF type:complete len:169 (-),score=40.73 TRINITY_DN240_c0_g1_i3:90-551(-)
MCIRDRVSTQSTWGFLQFMLIAKIWRPLCSVRAITTEINKKIPVDSKEYSLKKADPKEYMKKVKQAEKEGRKQIGFFKIDAKVEYEWTKPGPDDTGLNPEYDTVKVPHKENYKYTEYGYKLKGPEPTRYGDWERHGRVTDFQFSIQYLSLIHI